MTNELNLGMTDLEALDAPSVRDVLKGIAIGVLIVVVLLT